jgi:hypothetical protein
MIHRGTIRFAILAALVLFAGCGGRTADDLTQKEKEQIGASIRQLVTETYDLSKPNAVERLMSLYPESGPVYSASSGHISTTRAELQEQIETFWKYVGSNMRNPKWEWTAMHIDVLGPDVAALTASYRIPHLTPRNTPHVIAGAWSAVMVKRHGKWVVIQEHLSDVPSAAAGSAQAEDHSGH